MLTMDLAGPAVKRCFSWECIRMSKFSLTSRRLRYILHFGSMVSNSADNAPGVSLMPMNITAPTLRAKWNIETAFSCAAGRK